MNYPKIIEHLKKIHSPSNETCHMLECPDMSCEPCFIYKMAGKPKSRGGWGCAGYFHNNKGKIIQTLIGMQRKEKLEKLLK